VANGVNGLHHNKKARDVICSYYQCIVKL